MSEPNPPTNANRMNQYTDAQVASIRAALDEIAKEAPQVEAKVAAIRETLEEMK